MAEPGRVVACTIVARNYVPAARVLSESYRRQHAQEFAVLAVDADRDELPGLAAKLPGLQLLCPADLDLPAGDFDRMAMAYTVTELSTAVKPLLLRRLLVDHRAAIYLDPDIEVFSPFADEVAELAEAHDIVLTPHVLEPMPRDGLRPTEADIMASGVFNLGFIAVGLGAGPFLEFWSQRLRRDAISAIDVQLFTDQRWVDNVPAMFRHTVIRDPGFNVAYWNVYQRPVAEAAGGTLTAGGAPLRFLHYSGYRPERPWQASMHYADRPRIRLSEWPLLARLFDGYRDRLLAAGYARELDDVPYRWNTLPGGDKVSLSLRRAFRQAWIDAERRGEPPPASPLRAAEPDAVDLSWATEPADAKQRHAGLNRWAMALWRLRPSLQHAFPDPLGEDAAQYHMWCSTFGVAEGEIHLGAMAAPKPARTVPVRDEIGVNVLGYLTAELGVGELGRLVHGALVASGLPVTAVVEEQTVTNRTWHPPPEGAGSGDPAYPVSVLCVNADMMATTARLHPQLCDDRYVIGVWSWELDDFPPAMHQAFTMVNEVWTTSAFCAAAIARHAPVPVHVFPVPVLDPWPLGQSDAPPADRRDDRASFLFVFDHNSVFERKNPLAAVAAFRRAFGGRDDVRLVIKSINGDRHPGDRERLRAAVAGDDRIELIEEYLSAPDVHALFVAASCYVSLHRSEGFGLTVAEAMAHGLPVIATGYSATSELLTADTGWPVPYRLVPVGPGNPPYPPESRWAQPDLDAAAEAMCAVADDPAAARVRGAAARRHVLDTRSQRAAADWVRARVEAAHGRWPQTRMRVASWSASVAAVREAREALRWRADADAPSRLPFASTMRRVVLRAIDHYDHHQRTVLHALMDGVESGLGQLSDRLTRLEQQLAVLQADHAAEAGSARRADLADLVELAELTDLAGRGRSANGSDARPAAD